MTQAIRALVEKMEEISIQSFVWKIDLLARLRDLSISYEVVSRGRLLVTFFVKLNSSQIS